MRVKSKIAVAVAAAGVLAGVAVGGSAAVAAEDDRMPSIVEDHSYPGADRLAAERGIRLISGDGRITLLPDCTGTAPKIQVETFDAGSERYYCFAVKGDRGHLTLNVPNVYLIMSGDEELWARYTVSGEQREVTVEENDMVGIGVGDPDAGVLLELRAG